ncbi:MAG: DUF3617 domain-containing protein [Candidatus Sphingomonas colombiensis]|nr:DUF3617 domain-containing protein [Sphingomonas sp.]WEK42846.1 MAG: DUF3617 domain-containing protein [Sphingomonas sp.]
MKLVYAVALAPLVLAGCNNKPEVKAENASVAEVAAAANNAIRMEPGKWRTEVSVDTVDVANMPPQVADTMKRQLSAAGKQTVEACVTKEQAERPPEDMLGGNGMKSCRYDTFEIKGGKLNAEMTCQGAPSGPGAMHSKVSGDFGSSGYDLISEAKVDMNGQTITTKTKIKGTRIGACDAKAG